MSDSKAPFASPEADSEVDGYSMELLIDQAASEIALSLSVTHDGGASKDEGIIFPMTPQQAATLAMALIRAANMCAGGGGPLALAEGLLSESQTKH